MLRPKVQKILNEKFREHSNVLFLNYNLELTVGLQRLPRPDPVACCPSPLPVYSVCIYSRGK
jgi:hypothetical protein